MKTPIRRAAAKGLAGACVAAGLAAAAQAHHTEWPVKPYYEFVNALSLMNVDVAVAQFAEDAEVIDGNLCPRSAPCRGREAIREGYVLPMIRSGIAPPIIDQRFDGSRMRTREHVFELGHTGIERLVVRQADLSRP